MDQLQTNLKTLRLHYLHDHLDDFLLSCNKGSWSPVEIINRMTELELVEKTTRSTAQRMKAAKIGKFRHIGEFDWSHPKGVDKEKIMNLFSLDFLTEKRNVIMAGSSGLGKTMIARNLAFQAVSKGYTALFTTAASVVMDLASAESPQSQLRKLKAYSKPDLLVLDEIGYLSFDQKSADLIFEIVNRRYEQGSIIITTNLAFKDWGEIFPGSPCVTAMIDRLTHHCDILKIEGASYRQKESKRDKK
jgi:DNA replication protein DnaC